MSGMEPSDAIRVVNALLTQIGIYHTLYIISVMRTDLDP